MKLKLSFLTAVLWLLAASAHVFSQKNITGELDAFFKKAEKNGWSGSVLVANGSLPLLEKGYGWQDREGKIRQTAETVFSVGSITKQFTAAAILKLEMQGKISVEDKLSKHFPEAPADKANITLHQLLTHTAGCQPAIGDDYENIDAEEFMKRFFRTELLFAPGEAHEYSNVGYTILGILIEKISGKNYETYLHENLWKPAGMTRTGYLRPGHKPSDLAVGYRNGERWGTALDRPWAADGPGWHLRANGGVLSTVGDMHRWFVALQGEKVLDKTAKEKYWKGHSRECPDCSSFYGYGWVVDQTPDNQTIIWHNGGNGVYNAFMGFKPSGGLCVVISSNSNDKIADNYAAKVQEILAGVYQPLDEKTVEKHTRSYRLPSGSAVRVRFDELDKMWMEWDDADGLQALAGDGSETAGNTKPILDQTLRMVKNAREGKADELATALDVSPDRAASRAAEFWGDQEQAFGKFQKLEPVGAVLRPQRKVSLVYLKAVFEKKTLFLTYVWFGERLDDVRVAGKMEKEFEHENANEFFSPGNRMRAILQADGSILLRSKDGKEAILKN